MGSRQRTSLVDRGFSVDVFDRSSLAGGKARSLEVLDAQQPRPSPWDGRKRPATGSSVRSWLPGEHGFRFFPGFYKHVIDTMRRIPFGDCTVADNLVATSQVHIARFGQAPVFYPARFPESPGELRTAVTFVVGLLAGQMDIPPNETAFFVERVFQIVSSCEERRLAEYEKIDWWKFVQADAHSLGYQKFFANGFTRSLVAAKAERASTKTIGDIFVQMILSALTPFDTADRVLMGRRATSGSAPGIATSLRAGSGITSTARSSRWTAAVKASRRRWCPATAGQRVSRATTSWRRCRSSGWCPS